MLTNLVCPTEEGVMLNEKYPSTKSSFSLMPFVLTRDVLLSHAPVAAKNVLCQFVVRSTDRSNLLVEIRRLMLALVSSVFANHASMVGWVVDVTLCRSF